MKRLLIVEDSFILRQALVQIIEMIAPNWVVYTAQDGQRGYEMAVEIEPDLILTDYEMPILDGAAMIRLIRKTPRIDQAPIAVMTGINCDRVFRELGEASDWCIQKPIGLVQIQKLLKGVEKNEPTTLYPFYTAVKHPILHAIA